MSERHGGVVASAVEQMLDGTQATCSGPACVRNRVAEHASAMVERIGGSWPQCAQLADLMIACYHLGRIQALERVAIGLAFPATEGPEPANEQGLSKDGRLVQPDRAESPATGQGRDPCPNVSIEDEEVDLWDAPRAPEREPSLPATKGEVYPWDAPTPPDGFPHGTPPPDTVENPAKGA